MTKRNNKIEKRLRKQISLYFYNSNHPELYTTDEIIRYEIEVDKIMGIFNQFIPILLHQQREKVIEEVTNIIPPIENGKPVSGDEVAQSVKYGWNDCRQKFINNLQSLKEKK